MSRFGSNVKLARCRGVSYAWIGLHRCVESLANLTGEPFRAIFARLEAAHGFSRTDRSRWPDLRQIHAAADQVAAEHAAWMDELRVLIAERKAQKRAGRRHRRDGRLEEMQRQGGAVPRVGGPWAWRKRRGGR